MRDSIPAKAVAVLALLAVAGCGAPPVSTSGTDNGQVPLDTLFTHDGCTVYRFRDGGRSHYWVNCPGRIDSQRTESCGKNCTTTHDDSIQTTERP